MRIMLDTNFLISAFAVGGKIRKIFNLLLTTEWEIIITEYIDSEFRRVINKKFSKRAGKIIADYEENNFKIFPSMDEILATLRDKKDIPALSDAIFHDADILLTGDRDFSELNIKRPLIISPTILFEYLSAD